MVNTRDLYLRFIPHVLQIILSDVHFSLQSLVIVRFLLSLFLRLNCFVVFSIVAQYLITDAFTGRIPVLPFPETRDRVSKWSTSTGLCTHWRLSNRHQLRLGRPQSSTKHSGRNFLTRRVET